MRRIIIYIHGKGGNAEEANHYRSLFSESDVVGFDYTSQNPWDAKNEFPGLFDSCSKAYDEVILIANSIGAFFAMSALAEKRISKALFISPIVNMEKLITDMMMWSNVTEDELESKKEIPTEFGETLSWEYLCYVRRHPIQWHIPSCIRCTASICSCIFSPPGVTILQQCASISLDHFCSLPIGMLWNRPAEPIVQKLHLFLCVEPVLTVLHYGKVCALFFRKFGYGFSGGQVILSTIQNAGWDVPFNRMLAHIAQIFPE